MSSSSKRKSEALEQKDSVGMDAPLLSLLSLEGKIAVVSGAAMGIGQGICIALAELGATIVALDLTDASDTVELVKALGKGDAMYIQTNMTKPTEIEKAFATAEEKYGSIDISIAVVGGGPGGGRALFLEQSFEMYEGTIAMTQHSCWFQTQTAAKAMKKQGNGGKIVIIGSIMADLTSAKASAYSMSKCAIRQLGKTIALELAPYRINVNIIQPGYIDTPGERKLASDTELSDAGKRMPWGRLGKGKDIGNLAAFLCSNAADYMTGSVIDCDGGYKCALAIPGLTQDAGSESKKAKEN
eukprot:m.114918 g.114918  ORF g.114918 m.114918 type:complete len:299 (-) comp28382_c0_seq1:18-914(-)